MHMSTFLLACLILASSIPAREPVLGRVFMRDRERAGGEDGIVHAYIQVQVSRIQAHVKERQVPYMHTGAGPSLTSAKRTAESFRPRHGPWIERQEIQNREIEESSLIVFYSILLFRFTSKAPAHLSLSCRLFCRL